MSEAAETLLQERQREPQDNIFGDEEVVLRKEGVKLHNMISAYLTRDSYKQLSRGLLRIQEFSDQ